LGILLRFAIALRGASASIFHWFVMSGPVTLR